MKEKKSHKINISEINKIAHEKWFIKDSLRMGGYAGDILKVTSTEDKYEIIFDDSFQIDSLMCEEEPIVNEKGGYVEVVSKELDEIMSVLDSKNESELNK